MLKLVVTGLIQYYRNDRKDFMLSCLFMSALLVFVVGGMTLASIMDK
jgi:hypothetical protein